MKVVYAEEMQDIDHRSIKENGIPGSLLMGMAGKAIADEICKNSKSNYNIAIFAGTGNNGGDGFAAAYYLSNKEYKIKIYLTGNIQNLTTDTSLYYNICKKLKIEIIEIDENSINNIKLDSNTIIIDSLIGTGFKGKIRGTTSTVIDIINRSNSIIISADIPSGLPANGESPEGNVVKANITITMGLPKIGLVTFPGKDYTGELIVADLGFPIKFTNSENLKIELTDSLMSKDFFEEKNQDIHKGNRGHLLLVGGFNSMEGAILMSAMSALETGIGLVTLLTSSESKNIIAGKIPELMVKSISINSDNNTIQSNIESLLLSRKYDVIVIGPGMGRETSAGIIFESILKLAPEYGIKKITVDGDGLYHLSEYLHDNKLPKDIEFVLTPHFNEATFLIDENIDIIKKNRLKSTIDIADKTGSIVLLKGPATIISDGEKSYINSSGNSLLATAGSGDVLSGIIGALLLRPINSLKAVATGAFIHGQTSDYFKSNNPNSAMKATDEIELIRTVINNLF